MLHGFHVILSTYGFWLPNDPRGSWSNFVRRWELAKYGKATKVSTRSSVAARPHNRVHREAAKKALRYPAVCFTGVQALSVGKGFGLAAEEGSYPIFACSILPEHVHLVIGPIERDIRRVVGHLKARATQQLAAEGLHPLAAYRQKDGTVPSPWGVKSWEVYIFSDDHMPAAIRYVEDNPVKEGKRKQRWSFVTPYEREPIDSRSKLRR